MVSKLYNIFMKCLKLIIFVSGMSVFSGDVLPILEKHWRVYYQPDNIEALLVSQGFLNIYF